MAVKAAIFDAYGTLLDVTSATRHLVGSGTYPILATKGELLTDIWRTKQLQYSWLRSLMGDYIPFWQCTTDALDFALEQTGLDGDPALRDDLLSLYRIIAAYDDAAFILKAMSDLSIPCAILSNGNHDMLAEAIAHAGIQPHLSAVLSVDAVGIFKPSPDVYQMGCDAFSAKPEEILFFSSNGWDIAGAGQFGYQTIWVNRAKQVAEKCGKPPMAEVGDLRAAFSVAEPFIRGK